MFRDVKVGDRVWDIRFGWGTVRHVSPLGLFPLRVEMDLRDEGEAIFEEYTWEGYVIPQPLNPTLFWDEIVIKAPEKPVRLVERTFEGWVNLYEVGDPCFHSTKNGADLADSGRLGVFSVSLVIKEVPECVALCLEGFNELA